MPKKENEEAKEKDEDLGNIFDRIFKENGEEMFTPFVKMKFGLEVTNYIPLQEKIPKTLEREVDFLYKITTETNEEHILHIEFQSNNDKWLIYRIQEYHGLILRKYRMPILHMVLYFGADKSTMITQLPLEHIFTGFALVCINEIESDEFLNSELSGMVILALLGKYEKEQTEEILNLTFTKLRQLAKANNIPSRYINQLLLLSKLRKLDKSITQKIKTMPIFTEAMIKDHALYKEGKEAGIAEKEAELAEKKAELAEKEAELRKAAEEKEAELRKAAEQKEIELKTAEQKVIENILRFYEEGVNIKIIAKSFDISVSQVQQIIENSKNQSPKK